MPEKIKEDRHLFLNILHLQGYKSIVDLKIDLTNGLNILIGKNGAGKSNFLECIYRVMRSHYGGVNPPPYKFAMLELSSSNKHKFIMEFRRVVQKHPSDLERVTNRVLMNEKLTIDGSLAFDNFAKENNFKFIELDNKTVQLRGGIRTIISRLGYYTIRPLYIEFNIPNRLDCINTAGTIKIPLTPDDVWETPRSLNFIDDLFFDIEFGIIDDNFKKAKSITKAFLLKHLKIRNQIIENLNRYSPIQNVRFNENVNIYTDEKVVIVENLKLEFKLNNNWLPWSQLSDGTKRLFYLISEITHMESGLILIEEPELGIHPHQFNLVMNFLKEQADEKQIILSTHSPKALDHLDETELNNIIVASYTTKVGTQIKHLSTAQKKKATIYMKEVGFLSDYWVLSDLE